MAERWSMCPFCGLHIVRDDERRKISHQAPECAKFTALCARANGAGAEVTLERRDEAGNVIGKTQVS